MTVWQRITRYAVLGVALGALTACNMVGWSINDQNGPGIPNDTWSAGYMSSVEGYQNAFLIGGNYHSQAGSIKFNQGAPTKIRTQRIVKPILPSVCPWTELVCNGIAVSNPEGRVGIITTDTSGDGRISGAADFQANGGDCGMTDAATVSYGANMSPANAWLDTPTCKTPNIPGTFTSALTEISTAQGWGGTSTNQSPNNPVSAFRRMPFEVMQQLINSLESSDITVDQNGMQGARFQVTNLKIGGDSYRPINVYVTTHNWGAFKWDMSKEPGLKLMAGWAANKIEQLLNRGATSIRTEVELNGSVTLTKDSLPADIAVTEPSFSTVESWRNFATTNLRHD